MIRIGIVGTGGMARQHAKNFNSVRGCRVTACADIVPGRAREFADRFEIPAAYEDAAEMFDKERLDAVSVVTVDAAHAPVSLAAIKRGLHVMCEKPLADTLANARKMTQAARLAKIMTAMNFTWRARATSQMAARLVATGKLGDLRHVEGEYLQGWLTQAWQSEPSLLWRLSKRHGSAGVLGDLGVHLLDLVQFVVGDVAALACDLSVFDKGKRRIGEYVLDANDSMSALVRFKNGARGTLNTTRWAKGHGNTVRLRVYGDKGALDLDTDRPEPEQLKVSLGKGKEALKWTPVKCPQGPTQQARFVAAIRSRRPGQTSFEGGLRIQEYLEACFKSADRQGAWMKV